MSQRTLNGNIALNRLKHVRAKKKNKSGEEIEVLIIPIEANKLEKSTYKTKNGEVTDVNLPLRIIVRSDTDDKGQDGFIAKNIGSKTYKNSTEEEKKAFADFDNDETKKLKPILGNIKDFSKSENTVIQNQAISNEIIDADDDDLPF